jgi:hypothetical protein
LQQKKLNQQQASVVGAKAAKETTETNSASHHFLNIGDLLEWTRVESGQRMSLHDVPKGPTMCWGFAGGDTLAHLRLTLLYVLSPFRHLHEQIPRADIKLSKIPGQTKTAKIGAIP